MYIDHYIYIQKHTPLILFQLFKTLPFCFATRGKLSPPSPLMASPIITPFSTHFHGIPGNLPQHSFSSVLHYPVAIFSTVLLCDATG